jgi:glycosyltransferase involved in cell wall biosynthesis
MKTNETHVGIEMRVMAGPMTGIGNYSFHIMKSLLRGNTDLRFSGFDLTSWRSLDHQALDHIAASKELARENKSAGGSLAGLKKLAIQGLRQSRLAPALYRAQFARTVKRQSFDLFHAFNFLPFSDPGVVTLPVVYDLSFIRYPQSHPAERLRRLEQLPRLLERTPLVHTISEFSRGEIAELLNYPSDRIFVAPPAASEIFQPRGREHTRAELKTMGIAGDYYLAVGTLEPRKNLRTLITAFGRLSKAERMAAPLVIAGGGGWGALELPPETEMMRAESSLIFVGGVSNTGLRALYEGARALMFPSIYEGFGMPVVEAMACGTTAVHSSRTSMDEITAGTTMTVSALDVDAWTEAFRATTPDAATMHDTSMTLQRQAARFNWDHSAELVRNAYRQLKSY